jgi:hypothetical protein
MKEQLIAILEAMRLSQAALRKHSEPDGPTAEVTLKELRRFLLESHGGAVSKCRKSRDVAGRQRTGWIAR